MTYDNIKSRTKSGLHPFSGRYVFGKTIVESKLTPHPSRLRIKRVYEEKLLATKLRKSTLKNLIKDTCMKTAFSYNNKVYKQIDGVSMGSSLGPVLKIVVSDLINSGLIKFYARYVDDTLLLPKEDDIDNIV